MSDYQYEAGQVVMCCHKGNWYQARVLESKNKDGVESYKIHYFGWNKNWDEWVDLDRIQESREPASKMGKKFVERKPVTSKPVFCFSNLYISFFHFQQLDGLMRGTMSIISPSATGKIKDGDDEKKKGKRSSKASRMLSENFFIEHNKEVSVVIPDELKDVLLDDNYKIVKNNMIIEIPARLTVDKLLENYVRERGAICTEESGLRNGNLNFPVGNGRMFSFEGVNTIDNQVMNFEDMDITTNKGLYSEFAAGVIRYFNETLPTQLLYKFERVQLQDLIDNIKKEIPPYPRNNSPTDESSSSSSDENNHDGPPAIKFSSHYGPVHLLRLLTKMPKLLTYFEVEEVIFRMLIFFLEDLQFYLKDHCREIFSTVEYNQAGLGYIRRAL